METLGKQLHAMAHMTEDTQKIATYRLIQPSGPIQYKSIFGKKITMLITFCVVSYEAFAEGEFKNIQEFWGQASSSSVKNLPNG